MSDLENGDVGDKRDPPLSSQENADVNDAAVADVLSNQDNYDTTEFDEFSENADNTENQGGDVDADDVGENDYEIGKGDEKMDEDMDMGEVKRSPDTPQKQVEVADNHDDHDDHHDDDGDHGMDDTNTRVQALSIDDGQQRDSDSQRMRKISIHGLARRRSQSKLDIPQKHLTTATFDWSKNLFWAVVRLFIFFCTSLILTTLIGNYTNVNLGCYHDGRVEYTTRSDGWEFTGIEDNCDGNQDFILLYYHLGNIFFFLVCLLVLVDCVSPGPWHRPSLGYTLRQFSLKFRTWEEDHVGIHFIRLMAHLLVVCYGNCDIVDSTKLSDDDYFVYFQDLLEDYDYVHFSMFIVAIVVFVICVVEDYVDMKMLIWWNTPTDLMTDVEHTNSYKNLWPHYYQKYRFSHDDDANALIRYLDIAFTFKGYVWFIAFMLTCALSLFFQFYHLINVNTTDDCTGTKFGKMSFVFISQVLVNSTVMGYLVYSSFWRNMAGGVDGRSWILTFWLLMMGYTAVEPKYRVNYNEFPSIEAIDNLRIVICWSGLITLALGVFNTIVHKAYFPVLDFWHAPLAVLHLCEHLFFHGGFMILASVLILISLGQWPLIAEGVVFTFECKPDSGCSPGTNSIPAMTFRSNNVMTVLVLMPIATLFVFVLYTFWDRTKKIGKERVVPFHQFGLWCLGMLAFIVLNASSYRALDATADFYSEVLDYAWDSDTQPTKVSTSNGYTAAENVHFFVTVGMVLLWFFYCVSFVLQRSLVQEYRSKMPEEANQLFAGWLLPLGLSAIAFIYSLFTVYNEVHFVVVDKKFEIPDGLKDLFISGPIFSTLIIVIASMVSALRSHILTPVSRKTVGTVGFATLFSSATFVLLSVEMLDDFVNRGGNFRVHMDGLMELFMCYLLTFVALMVVVIDETAEALPLYQFQKLGSDVLTYEDHDLLGERFNGQVN